MDGTMVDQCCVRGGRRQGNRDHVKKSAWQRKTDVLEKYLIHLTVQSQNTPEIWLSSAPRLAVLLNDALDYLATRGTVPYIIVVESD
jgi:hypothetical protein